MVKGVLLMAFIAIIGFLLRQQPEAPALVMNQPAPTEAVAPVAEVQAEPMAPAAATPVEPITEPAVAPETEAALAQFGLSATSVAKIIVVAQARPPVIIPNPLNHKMQ